MASDRCVLDTGIVIRDLRGDGRAAMFLATLGRRYIMCVSAMTIFEVIRGCRSPEQERRAEDTISRLSVLDIDYETSVEAGRLVRANSGVLQSERAAADSLIAASAVVAGAQLATLNTRQFAKVQWPGLGLILIDQDAADWTMSLR
jgi:predicted nucleic acid-binding protein